MENQNLNYGNNEGEDINKLNPNQQQRQSLDNEEDTSLASDGPVSESEGDGDADLYETDVIPGSEDEFDDLDLNPDDDPESDVGLDDLEALDGLDEDDDETMS
jgi:hypothetical protein